MISIDQYFNTITWLSVLLSIVCAYLIIQVPRYYRLKYIIIPLLFAIVFISTDHFTDVLGSPYFSYPEGEVVIKSHRIVKFEDGEKRIEIWVMAKDGSRLYSIPYNDRTAQELAKAAERGRNGRPQVGRFKKKEEEGGIRHSIDDQPELETHPLPNLFETMKKEDDEPQTNQN